MKNLLVFFSMWVVALPLVAYLTSINRGDFKAFLETYFLSLLTATTMYVTLSFIAVLF